MYFWVSGVDGSTSHFPSQELEAEVPSGLSMKTPGFFLTTSSFDCP